MNSKNHLRATHVAIIKNMKQVFVNCRVQGALVLNMVVVVHMNQFGGSWYALSPLLLDEASTDTLCG